MGGIPDRFHARILDLVLAAMADIDAGRSVWAPVFAELGGQFGATLGGLISVDWPAGETEIADVWPAWARAIAASSADNRAYPLIRHFCGGRDTRPRTLDDVPDTLGWRSSARYAAMRAQFGGAAAHVMMPLAGPTRLFGVGRPGRNFGADEMAYAGRLQPVLTALDRHVATVSRWRDGGRDRVAAVAHGITPRELVVLTHLADGLDTTGVARRLGISPRTVGKHQENLQRKLRTQDRLNTVLRAQQLGLV